MKKISAAVAMALFAVLAVYEAQAQGTDPIQTIRQQYAAINRGAARYKKVKKELLGFSAEGGELVAFTRGPSIVKITATFYGEMGRATDEFYYANDKLIFIFRKHSHYNRPLTGKVVRTTENRYYFKDDKLIRWIGEDGKQVSTTAPEFTQVEARLLASSKQFVEGAQSKNPTIEDVP
ncbi:MAG TPA: hypothetical protein VFX97_10395 [Pyrinomonadaceae bacterium]|nr:hypothetical protein [Pyrinomonadaceae bacterium]